jgi:hypothetical protein
MNYSNWQTKRWKTEVSDLQWLFFESLTVKEWDLKIILSDQDGNLFEVAFKNHPAYRSKLEEYSLDLFGSENIKNNNLGNTWIVENSDWIKHLNKTEPLITHHEKELNHYLIVTQSEVIEVLSSETNPKITRVKNSS